MLPHFCPSHNYIIRIDIPEAGMKDKFTKKGIKKKSLRAKPWQIPA